MTETDKSWYLIYTKSRMETVARENLQRQGYITYLPMLQMNKRFRGRYRAVVEAMFPRYLFIQLDTKNDNWSPIRSTLGVHSMVQFGGIPARAPASLIAQLRLNEKTLNSQSTEKSAFNYGDAVEFVTGSLQGYKAVFDKYVSADRVAVLLGIIGEYTRTFVSKHDLQHT